MNEHISEQVDDVKGYVYVGVWMDVHMGFPDGAMLCLVTQLCPTFCDPMDCSLPGCTVQGIFQARILEWIAMSSSNIQ